MVQPHDAAIFGRQRAIGNTEESEIGQREWTRTPERVKGTKVGAPVDELVRVQEEIRQGNFVSAETILDTILDRPDEITSHLLFDLTNA